MVRQAALIALIGLAACSQPAAPTSGTPAQANMPIATAAPTWINRDASDEMHGTKMLRRSIDSTDTFTNQISGDPKPTRLTVQQAGKRQQVYIENANLQFMCTSFSETYVEVKFDQDAPKRYRCTPESTQAFGFAFIENEPRFIKRLNTAHSLAIGADVYQRGTEVMHFTLPAGPALAK